MTTSNALKYGLYLLLLTTFFLPPSPSSAESVDDFIQALSPNGSSLQLRTRGLGGIQTAPSPPQKAMQLNFALNSAQLTASAKHTLDQLGQALRSAELQNYVYRLEGHTCDRGSFELNEDLSKLRAFAVQRYLMNEYNLPPEQLEVVWFGESQPFIPNTDESTRKQNRRVMIINTLDDLNSKTATLNEGIHIRALKGGTESMLSDGQSMTKSDNYALKFIIPTESFVYIFQKDGEGKLSQIFPNNQVTTIINPIQPDTIYRIPEPGKWFFLDDTKGEEELLMVASESQIEDSIAIATEILTTDKYTGITRGLGGIHRKTPKVETQQQLTDTIRLKSTESSSSPEEVSLSTKYAIYRRTFMHD